MKLLDKDGLTYYTSKIKGELTDYVKNTDYASSSVGGVIKTSGTYGTGVSNGSLFVEAYDYTTYNQKNPNFFIGKGTLENVITGKGLTTKAYVDGLVGDIQTLLDNLDVGNGVS